MPVRVKFRSIVSHFFRDINQEELDIYKIIPKQLKPFFPGITHKNGTMLIAERPMDFDNSFSKPLLEYEKISNTNFWNDVDSIAGQLVKHKLWLFDVFHLGNNIIVKRISKNEYKPVIVDFKRFGYSCYPLQLNLLLDSEKEKKLYRRLERFKRDFREI